jgi:putative tricarboxylic transport membrane protein
MSLRNHANHKEEALVGQQFFQDKFALATIAALALSIVTLSVAAQAPAWRPEKAVELIAASAPGGSNDKSARAVQKILQDEKILPVPVNVVNKTGGNQSLSRAYLNTHPGDAHYFNMANPTILSNHIAGVTPQHHSDLTPVALLFNEYAAFTVRADSPIRNARDLIARLSQDPESLPIGISNRGGTNHLALALLVRTAGIDPKRLKIVVFKGNSESITALLGGHIQLVASTVTSAIGQVQAGKARMISIASPRRMPGTLAEVPTLREQGYDVSLSNFRVLVGAKGLGASQVTFWENAMARVVATEEWRKDLESQYWEGNFLRSRETASYLDNEYRITKAVMSELGVAK